MSKFLKGVELLENNVEQQGYFIPCLTGKGAPTEAQEGAIGSLYLDEDNGDIYKCIAINNNGYQWVKETKTGTVQTVNGIAPDENGNVNIVDDGSGVVVSDSAPDDTSVLWVDTNDNETEGGGGLSTAQITALDNLFKVCAFIKADVTAEYAAFKAAFGVPEATMTSISAVYSGGNVTAGTSVNALTGIVVTAHYSDGSTKAVSGYTLSGTIAEGSNTVTVTYQGMTTTFDVTGYADEDGLLHSFDFTKSLVDSVTGETALVGYGANSVNKTNPTQNENGLAFNDIDHYAVLTTETESILNKTVEIAFGDIALQAVANSGYHARVFMVSASANTSSSAGGLVYKGGSGGWTMYSGKAWASNFDSTLLADAFSNKTIKLYINSEGYMNLYIDGEFIAVSSIALTVTSGLFVLGGSGKNYFYDSVIKSVRIYEGEV